MSQTNSQTNNQIINDEETVETLYNEERKTNFLNQYDDLDTRKTYKRIFSKSAFMERKLSKDLCDFNKLEIEDVLYDLNPLTKISSESNGRIVTAYIAWCIEEGVAKVTTNILKTVDSPWFIKFVDKTKKLYLSEKELRQIEDKCENLQDAVIFRLLFNGVNGQESIEIRMLNRDDVNGNVLTLRDDHGNFVRSLEVDDRTLRLVQGAFMETTYMKRNGKIVENVHVRAFTDLIDNNFIVRGSRLGKRNKSTTEPVVPSVIYRRVSAISESLDIPYFTSKNIFRSGVIYMGYQILKEKHENNKGVCFTTEDYIKIAEHFNIKNYYTLKDYCNLENVEKLYGKFE